MIWVIITIGATLTIKSIKVKFPKEPIIMFGGSPISVAVPPIFEAKTVAMIYGTGFSFSLEVMEINIGTMKRTVVTLSKNADKTAVSIVNVRSILKGFPFVIFNAREESIEKKPLSISTETIIIIPIRRNIVLWSIDSQACLGVTTPINTANKPPNKAAGTLWNTFSRTIIAYVPINKTIESQ